MKAQIAHKNILVVGATSYTIDKVDVLVLSALTACVVLAALHDDVTDLVQDAMGLSNFQPPFSPPLSVKIHSQLLEINKALRGDVTNTTGNGILSFILAASTLRGRLDTCWYCRVVLP